MTQSRDVNRQRVFRRRPDGLFSAEDFELRETARPVPVSGSALIRSLYFSFDPTQRYWLNEAPGYMPPMQFGEPVRAIGIGQVVKSHRADLKNGDVVVVSGAAGATGSVAGQIARVRGAAKVIGIAGGAAKCRWLLEKGGFDAAIDHRSESLGARLRELAPDGVEGFEHAPDTLRGLFEGRNCGKQLLKVANPHA